MKDEENLIIFMRIFKELEQFFKDENIEVSEYVIGRLSIFVKRLVEKETA
jgi:hypothetical protein